MNINIRFCRNPECGKGYDIGTNFDLCSECRKEKEDERNENKMYK